MAQRIRSQLGAEAPVLGFLVDLLEDGYQTAIAAGVLAAAKNAGASVHCFMGGVLGSPDRSALQRNHIYRLANRTTVDALVVLGGTLVNHVGPAALSSYFEPCRSMPMCSIAMPLDGMGSVLVNNEVGMRGAIEHLIKIHNFRRIAFVRGPLANAEAELRFQVYREALSQQGIPFDTRLVATGDFQAVSGSAAVARFFDEARFKVEDIDAIVVSNDNMAFGVLKELAARGIRVPEDIAVTGFDDVEEARYVNPGLTTVRQPLEEQGREAVRIVLLALQQNSAPKSLELATELVIRGSCGCSGSGEQRRVAVSDSLSLSFEAMLVSRRQHILNELARAARGTFVHAGANWEPKLISTVAGEISGESPGSTAKLFEELVAGLISRGIDVSYGHAVLDCLRRELLVCLRKETDRRLFAEDLFQTARVVIGRTAERSLGASRIRLEQWARRLSIVGARLIGTFDANDLRTAVHDNFPVLGIASCFIVTYEPGDVPSRFSQLTMAYESTAGQQLATPIRFATDNLLPAEILTQLSKLHNFVVAPLFFKKEVFGYLVVELDISQTFAYEAVRDLISAAIKGSRLVQDVKRQNVELDSALSIIRDREARYTECVSKIQGIMKGISDGNLTEPQEILRQILEVMSAGEAIGSRPSI
jgi:DNA-binding LacI/PurR family transcriptional regulator